MADTESIMRLGIEAARAGDKEEARNLFRLLTREQPDNVQAWLWLAGVAEDKEEKRAALERVLALDPTNDLARKGLQALGVSSPSAPQTQEPFSTRPIAPIDFEEPDEWAIESEPVAPSSRSTAPRQRTPDEDFAASLDSIGAYESFTRGETGKLENYTIPDFGEEESDLQSYMNRPRVRPEDIELEPEPEPAGATRRSNLVPILLMVGAAVIIAAFLFIFMGGDGDDAAGGGTQATATSEAPAGTVVGGAGSTATPAGAGEATPSTGGTPVSPATPPAETTVAGQPTFTPPAVTPTLLPQPAGGLQSATPQVVPANTVLEANGWFYNFPAPSYSTIIGGGLGDLQPQGRWLVVLMILYNDTGQPQTLPTSFFALKDVEGRIYLPNPEASERYVDLFGRGIAADYSMKDQLPVGVNISVPLLFDVSPGATSLVLFSSQNTSQGYLVQQSIQ